MNANKIIVQKSTILEYVSTNYDRGGDDCTCEYSIQNRWVDIQHTIRGRIVWRNGQSVQQRMVWFLPVSTFLAFFLLVGFLCRFQRVVVLLLLVSVPRAACISSFYYLYVCVLLVCHPFHALRKKWTKLIYNCLKYIQSSILKKWIFQITIIQHTKNRAKIS